MPHELSGEVTGLGAKSTLVFASSDFQCDVSIRNGRYAVRLDPGRYAVSYRVFGNFTRFICEVEVPTSSAFDIHYQPPKMTVRVCNLPAGTLGGMVYLQDQRGNHVGWYVEHLEQFDLDFQHEPDLFVKSFNQICIKVGGKKHRFPFKAQIGGALEIDFSLQ